VWVFMCLCLKDGDTSVLPLSVGHAKDESCESWEFVLQCLVEAAPDCVELQRCRDINNLSRPRSERSVLVAMSDLGPGLQAALRKVLPGMEVTFCTYHRKVC
jgi:hypothetical protein